MVIIFDHLAVPWSWADVRGTAPQFCGPKLIDTGHGCSDHRADAHESGGPVNSRPRRTCSGAGRRRRQPGAETCHSRVGETGAEVSGTAPLIRASGWTISAGRSQRERVGSPCGTCPPSAVPATPTVDDAGWKTPSARSARAAACRSRRASSSSGPTQSWLAAWRLPTVAARHRTPWPGCVRV